MAKKSIKKAEIPKPEKDIRIEPGAPKFKDALVNFVKNTSKKPDKHS